MMLSPRTLVLFGLLLGATAWAASGLLRAGGPGSSGIPTLDQRARTLAPEATCVAPERPAESGPAPRCTFAFGRSVGALAVPPEGTPAVISLVHAATGTWSLPAASWVIGFDPLPAEIEARAIVASAARDVALFAVGEEFQRYQISTGRLVARAPGPGGKIADLDWTADGAWMVVAAGGKGYVLGSGGKVARELPVEGNALHVAMEARGASAAVASDVGNLTILGFAQDSAPRSLTPSLQPAAGLAYASGLLWVAGSDGTLRAIDPATGAERAKVDVGSPLVALAIAADGATAATAARDRAIRLHALPSGEVVATLAWHPAQVVALGFGAGPTLLSGDADGALAVWDVPAAR
jgi:hypothetical protein